MKNTDIIGIFGYPPSIYETRIRLAQTLGKRPQPCINCLTQVWDDLVSAQQVVTDIARRSAPPSPLVLALNEAGITLSPETGTDWTDPEVDQQWIRVSKTNIADERNYNRRFDNARAYIWGLIGQEVIDNVTRGMLGENPSYIRGPSWVGAESVMANTMALVTGQYPHLLHSDYWHTAESAAAGKVAVAETT